jgi:hypothetical protein
MKEKTERVSHKFSIAQNRIERGAQLVAHIGR